MTVFECWSKLELGMTRWVSKRVNNPTDAEDALSEIMAQFFATGKTDKYSYRQCVRFCRTNLFKHALAHLGLAPRVASAILDRLLHHCRVINIKGHSYRLQGHAFAKQLSQKGGDTTISASPD